MIAPHRSFGCGGGHGGRHVLVQFDPHSPRLDHIPSLSPLSPLQSIPIAPGSTSRLPAFCPAVRLMETGHCLCSPLPSNHATDLDRIIGHSRTLWGSGFEVRGSRVGKLRALSVLFSCMYSPYSMYSMHSQMLHSRAYPYSQEHRRNFQSGSYRYRRSSVFPVGSKSTPLGHATRAPPSASHVCILPISIAGSALSTFGTLRHSRSSAQRFLAQSCSCDQVSISAYWIVLAFRVARAISTSRCMRCKQRRHRRSRLARLNSER